MASFLIIFAVPPQMLAFGKQPQLPMSAAVLPFWVSLLQQSSPRAELATPRHAPLPDDAAAALLDLAGLSCWNCVKSAPSHATIPVRLALAPWLCMICSQTLVLSLAAERLSRAWHAQQVVQFLR